MRVFRSLVRARSRSRTLEESAISRPLFATLTAFAGTLTTAAQAALVVDTASGIRDTAYALSSEPSWYRAGGIIGIALVVIVTLALGIRLLVFAWLNRRTRVLELWVAERTDALRTEVAERRRVEEALKQSEERYALALRGANDGIWDWDIVQNRVYYSPRFEAILGYDEGAFSDEPEEWLGRVHPDDARKVKAKLTVHRQGVADHFDDEHRLRHRDGGYRWVLFRAFLVRDESGACSRMVGSASDVTDRRAYDPLTGLPNRALFIERLTEALARARREPSYRFAVLFLDLERFNLINDSFGHLVGDSILAAVARRLAACLEPGDVMARFGGDEFAVLVGNPSSAQEAKRLAERFNDAIREPFEIGETEVVCSVTVGIALSELGYERPEDVLRDADIAMYRAKAEGNRRSAVFDVCMRECVTEKLQLENELRHAVDNGELEIHYQPIVSLDSGRIQGFEALLRWRHPRRGMLLPESFIPLAEETGLIVPIGYWTLDQACRQALRFRSAREDGRPSFISVNMSGRQFAEPDLPGRVRDILGEAGLENGRLRLEITESVLIETTNGIPNRLRELRDLDVSLDIDDFGKGYSSLSYLTSLPITALKIDRSFVSRIGRQADAATLVRIILSLARSMRIATVAEGVETAEQCDYLRIQGCDMAQGFLFSAAVDGTQASALLSS
jgi:diguanylate cyclase (GGDEF)-like protein/PAS domain S-box-containing protein